MKPAVIHVHRGGPVVALVGNPNCGKTALFNLLTGSRQKVANYAGVTVERKEGRLVTPAGRELRLLDLPGAYSLHPRSPDERVTADVLFGRALGEKRPDLVICVVDATNLRRNLRLVLAVRRLGLPCVVALNMADLAARRGLAVDAQALSRELGLPVVGTVGVQADGAHALRELLDQPAIWQRQGALPLGACAVEAPETPPLLPDHEEVHLILQRLGLAELLPQTGSDRIDRVVLHPLLGPLLLALLLFVVFQAVFVGAEQPMAWIEAGTVALGEAVSGLLAPGWLRSLLVDGVIAGAGGVLVFLPQIVILFFFILWLEESGYLPRAAFLLDRLMGGVGLSGRSFIPLLSSFACAIPGIMAARTIASPRDRVVTILIAPLMTCSARLPVYALLIGAFIPQRKVGGVFELQGLVLFGLYVAGVASALLVAFVMKKFRRDRSEHALLLELPAYRLPHARDLLLGLYERALIFLKRVGGIILALTILLWFLLSFPAAPADAVGPAIDYSFAGRIGRAMEPLFAPIGFNWQICIALIPGLAAREVAVSSLATVYALSAVDDDAATQALTPIIAGSWEFATALSLLVWFIYAPMCISTLAVIRRETNSWKNVGIAAGYLFGLAYLASLITYQVAKVLT